jgi:hypothetical protein
MQILSSSSVLLHDMQYGLKNLRRHPGYTAIIILSLALGIGASTAVFGWLDTFLFRKLPVPHPNALFQIAEVQGGHTGASQRVDLYPPTEGLQHKVGEQRTEPHDCVHRHKTAGNPRSAGLQMQHCARGDRRVITGLGYSNMRNTIWACLNPRRVQPIL